MTKRMMLTGLKRSTARKKRKKETVRAARRENLVVRKKLRIMTNNGKSKRAARVMLPTPGGTFTIRKIREAVRIIREIILTGRANL